jgi:hypothetical protein
MARIFEAASVVAMIPETRPPMPARQNILPAPSFVSFRAAWSAIAPTSAAPEHAKISFGAAPHAHALLSFIVLLPLLFFSQSRKERKGSGCIWQSIDNSCDSIFQQCRIKVD